MTSSGQPPNSRTLVSPIVWNLGKVRITQLVEVDAGSVIQEVIPKATKERIREIPWLMPQFAHADGSLKALVQTFVVETGNSCVVVDTCVGNLKSRTVVPEWGNLQTDFLGKFANLGLKREKVDVVLCTHLHFDHVGWNTMLSGGKWVPTFPRARYLFAEQEFRYWKGRPAVEIEDQHAGFADSVLPVFDAGLVDLVPLDHSICDEVSLFPTPGHTPAHVSVSVKSDFGTAIITGDVMHHPCQIANPEWEAIGDTDKELAKLTRRALLEKYADTPTLIIGSHFASPTGGHLRRENNGFRLIV